MDGQELVNAADLTYSQVAELEQKEGMSPEDNQAVAKFHLKDFCGLDVLAIYDVLWGNDGRRRGELLNLEPQLSPGLAVDRPVRVLEKQPSVSSFSSRQTRKLRVLRLAHPIGM